MSQIAESEIVRLAPGVVSHPHINSGAPSISPRWIGIRFIYGRFRSGESVEELARDYRSTPKEIEDGLRYAMKRGRKPL